MKKLIKSAYENVENLGDFDQKKLNIYRQEKIKEQEQKIYFFKKTTEIPILLDIGSGNSSLAYMLEKNNLLISSDCVELSKSRFEFANAWKNENAYNKTINYNCAISDFKILKGKYNTVTCLDNTLGYLGIYYSEDEIVALFNDIYKGLSSKGVFILEVTVFISILKHINVSKDSLYQKFEIEENEVKLWACKRISANIMNIKSHYINKECIRKQKEEVSYIYTKDKILELLTKVGFREVEMFSDFNKKDFNMDDKLIVVAYK